MRNVLIKDENRIGQQTEARQRYKTAPWHNREFVSRDECYNRPNAKFPYACRKQEKIKT